MVEPDRTTPDAFTRIYQEHSWGGDSRSGIGSSVAHASPYTTMLQDVLRDLSIASVLDLGCGDWSFSRHIDWSGIHYTGIDIVPELVSALQQKFGGSNVNFVVDNVLEMELPPADLVISKDVLQHLSHSQVERFLERLSDFRFALLTNDRLHHPRRNWRNLWRCEPIGVVNQDVDPGGWRPLRLQEAPYDLQTECRGRYTVREGDDVWVKEVLLWRNPAL